MAFRVARHIYIAAPGDVHALAREAPVEIIRPDGTVFAVISVPPYPKRRRARGKR